MSDCLNRLDDNETDADKISKAAHDFLLLSSIKDAKQVIKECQEAGTVFTESEIEKKTPEMTVIFTTKK